MMAPAAFRCHREIGGESPPPSSSTLTSPLDGRRVSPLVHGLRGGGGVGAPLRLDLSLFLCSYFWAFHRFLNSRRSVTPIGWNFNTIFIQILSFLRLKK